MIQFNLDNISTDFHSYQQLINLYTSCQSLVFEAVEISFTRWFAANLSAVLGGILDRLDEEFNIIHIKDIPGPIASVLSRNGFLSHFGFARNLDIKNTTIPYQKLKPEDGRFFNDYVTSQLLNRNELPEMNSALKKKIAESIYEMFVNAKIHSRSSWIYTCGQFFPKKNKIEFSLVDTGIGFRQNIKERFHRDISAEDAIKWAVKDGNSTKNGVPGGIGLAILNEFIIMNGGKIQIVSGSGFYSLENGKERTASFNGSFPGTIINMQFRTDDTHHYGISEGVSDLTDLF